MARSIIASAVLLAAAGVLHAQEPPFSIKSTELSPGLYMLDSADDRFVGGNMGLLMGDDGVVLIDDGIAEVQTAYLDAVDALTGQPVDYLINTHIHGDHVGNNAAVNARGATIVAHENIRDRMAAALGDGTYTAADLPTITFADGVALHINGQEIRVTHIATAHTDGDSMLYLPDANVVFAGDILFNGMFPFVDIEGGGSVNGMLRGLDRIIALADNETQIVSGHGPLASRADVQRARNVLADCRQRVRELVDRNMSEGAVVSANPLAAYHDDWNWDFITTERMTRTLYQSLTQ